MTLMKLRSLPPVREALFSFAVAHATRTKFMRNDKAVREITARALDAWLDPLCHVCSGRGFTGGFLRPMVLCPPCHGSGRRVARLGKTEDGEQFGRSLMNEMDRKTQHVSSRMRQFMNGKKAGEE
jgi:hypothetical protein